MNITLFCNPANFLKTRFLNPKVFNTFHTTVRSLGIEDFYDNKNNSSISVFAGRSWEVPDLRRKVKFDM